MTITFLGTGPAEGIPRNGHTDALCRDARRRDSKSRRTRSSALLVLNGMRALTDASPDFEIQKKRLGRGGLDAILLTHGHRDAIGGLPNLAAWLRARGQEDVPVYSHPDTFKRIGDDLHAPLRAVPVRPFGTFRLGQITVRCIPMVHGVTQRIGTYGFLFKRHLFYASDMERTTPRGLPLLHKTRTLVLDAAFCKKPRLPGHSTVAEILEFAARIRPRLVVLTQCGHSYPTFNIARHDIRQFVKNKNYPFRVQLGYDGLSLTI